MLLVAKNIDLGAPGDFRCAPTSIDFLGGILQIFFKGRGDLTIKSRPRFLKRLLWSTAKRAGPSVVREAL